MSVNQKYNKQKPKHYDNNSTTTGSSLKELELNIGKLGNIINTPVKETGYSNYYEYRVDYPKVCNNINNMNSKKYIGLMFYETENIDDSCTESFNESYRIFLELDTIYIINYSIVFTINEINENNKYSVFLGIKKRGSDKINVIKGSKVLFDSNTDTLNNNETKVTINNTLIHSNKEDSELYIIAQLDKNCTINSKKSYIKILKNN